jgi:outer membrane protein
MFLINLFFYLQVACAKDYTLKEVFDLALINQRTQEINLSQTEIAEAQKGQIKGALFPTISLRGIYSEIEPLPPSRLSAFTRTNQYNYGLRLNQPLFRGKAEYAALNRANLNLKQTEFENQLREMAIYREVIQSFYNLLFTQSDLKNLEELSTHSFKRLSEIRNRAKIGRSRQGELLEAESQYARVLVNLDEAKRNYEFEKINFERLTNLKEDYQLIMAPIEEKDETDFDLGAHPQIKSLSVNLDLTKEDLTIARSTHWPELNLEVNRYFNRTGILEDSSWDYSLNFNWRLFEGGVAASRSEEALNRQRLTSLELENTKNILNSNIKQLHSNFDYYQTQLKEAQKSVTASEKAWKLSQSDYQVGLVSNLDVLLALNNFIENKRIYERLKIQKEITAHFLKAEMGVMP